MTLMVRFGFEGESSPHPEWRIERQPAGPQYRYRQLQFEDFPPRSHKRLSSTWDRDVGVSILVRHATSRRCAVNTIALACSLCATNLKTARERLTASRPFSGAQSRARSAAVRRGHPPRQAYRPICVACRQRRPRCRASQNPPLSLASSWKDAAADRAAGGYSNP